MRRTGGGLPWTVSDEVPGRAVTRYEELFRQLAVEFPEMAFWANLVDHQATRAEVRRLGIGMEGLEQMLADIASGRVADEGAWDCPAHTGRHCSGRFSPRGRSRKGCAFPCSVTRM